MDVLGTRGRSTDAIATSFISCFIKIWVVLEKRLLKSIATYLSFLWVLPRFLFNLGF